MMTILVLVVDIHTKVQNWKRNLVQEVQQREEDNKY